MLSEVLIYVSLSTYVFLMFGAVLPVWRTRWCFGLSEAGWNVGKVPAGNDENWLRLSHTFLQIWCISWRRPGAYGCRARAVRRINICLFGELFFWDKSMVGLTLWPLLSLTKNHNMTQPFCYRNKYLIINWCLQQFTLVISEWKIFPSFFQISNSKPGTNDMTNCMPVPFCYWMVILETHCYQ